MRACNREAECPIVIEGDHRIANHMTMLASYVRLRRGEYSNAPEAQGSGEILRMFDRISAQVAAVAQLHRMLTASASVSSGDIGAQLGRLCDEFRKGPACDTVIEYSGDPGCFLHVSQILPVSQIVSEAVTNALKYGHKEGCAGSIRVFCLRESDGAISISVNDDGDGILSDQSTATKVNGIGSAMVAALARQVKGTIEYRSSPAGLSFNLRLSPARQEPPASQPSKWQSEGARA